MDPLFVATPADSEILKALELWPELAGKQVRPLLVSAFGDIFVESSAGDVLVASPIELTCEPVATSVHELEQLFADQSWADLRLLTEVVLLARDRGIDRPPDQVFSIAPHPAFTGSITADELVPMNLAVWHYLALQLRVESRPEDP